MQCPTCQACSMEPLAFCWWCPNCGGIVRQNGKVQPPRNLLPVESQSTGLALDGTQFEWAGDRYEIRRIGA